MRLLLDSDRRPIRLPPEGIALSKKLADILHIQPGELLTLEVLEGARPTRQVQVSGIFDELIGLSAYMDMGALNRLMRAATTVSGAYRMIDAQQQQQLYQQLKQTPAVASVSLRETVIQQFEEIIGQSMGGFNQVLVGFASIIAFGVVYNATRMAFSMVVWLTQIYDWELFRFPLVVTPASYAFAFMVISTAALASGWIIRRQLNQLDLVAVLKTRA